MSTSKPALLSNPVIVAAAGIVALGGVAKLVDRGTAQAAAVQPVATAGLYMGELVGRDARVVIIGTEHGTRFDIRTSEGGIIAAGLTADQVAALLPGQDPRGAMAQEAEHCGRLMLAEPDRHGIE